MRTLFIGAGLLLDSGSAWAQAAPANEQPSEDLICELSGDCGGFEQLEATDVTEIIADCAVRGQNRLATTEP